MATLVVHTDGGARGNPGPAAIGVVLDAPDFHAEHERTIGDATNNVAEYTAVLDACEQIQSIIAPQGIHHLIFYLDSELVVKQIRGEYRVKDPNLQVLHTKVHEHLTKISLPYNFQHIRRADNALADKLVNHALDSLNS